MVYKRFNDKGQVYYETDVLPNDPYWKTEEGQAYLQAKYPIERDFFEGRIEMKEFLDKMEEVTLEINKLFKDKKSPT